MAVISKGITLEYKDRYGSEAFIKLNNLMEIPELGGETESIEITTLADSAHIYTSGLENYGDTLSFKFLYESIQFKQLCDNADGTEKGWKLTLPDGTACNFFGTYSVKLDGVGVNAALTYTVNVKPSDEFVWAPASTQS